jgi:branched-chain amino acid transport system permease protein
LAVRALRLVRTRAALPVAGLAVAAALPGYSADYFFLHVLTVSWLLATLTVGLNVGIGYAGIFNMSQGTIYGVGAYIAAILVTRQGLPLEVAALGAMAVTGLLGWVLGLTTLRVRGDYWALVSMAFTLGAVKIFENWREVTGGRDGYVGIPRLAFFGLDLADSVRAYYVALAALAVVYVLVRRIGRSFAGRAMLATRYDDTAARMMGVSPAYFKLLAMTVTSAIAGFAGALLVGVNQLILPKDFSFLPSFNIMLFVIVGGLTSLGGAVVAATFLTYVTEQYRELTDFRLLILGTALTLAVFVRNGVVTPVVDPVRSLFRGRRVAANPAEVASAPVNAPPTSLADKGVKGTTDAGL